jgi:HPt (histidine-containing phosphotransfer) domain-containing protein
MSAQSLLDESVLEELRDISPVEGAGIVRELIDLFLEGAPQRISHINQCLADPAKLAFHAHALKSMGLNLGAKRVVDLSQKLEELARSGDLAGAPELARELEAAYNQTRLHLLPMRGA